MVVTTNHPLLFSLRLAGLLLPLCAALIAGCLALGLALLGAGQIVYVAATERESDLLLLDVERALAYNLTRSPGRDFSPAWSPDGRQIAFVSERDGSAEVYVMTADGRNLRRLTRNRVSDYAPRWSPDGLSLSYESQTSGAIEIYITDPDCPGLEGGCKAHTRMLTPNHADHVAASWSPDGQQVVFVAFRPRNLEVFIVPAAGGGLRRLTTHRAWDTGPVWSPDGREIAFVSYRDGSAEIYRMALVEPDGQIRCADLPDACESRIHRLSSSPAADVNPAWSPDGQWIAFESGGETARIIAVIGRDGTGQRALSPPNMDSSAPAWSPDSQRIAFVVGSRSGSSLYLVNADGSDLRRLTTHAGSARSPEWRP